MTILQMIDEQLIKRGIQDPRVLSAFHEVDRLDFMPTGSKHLAYIDAPVDIGNGQTTSQPYIIGYMLQALHIKPTDKVLEIGTGSGYQTALLSEMAESVFSVDIVEELYDQAVVRLHKRNNVFLKFDKDRLGWPDQKPFDKIVVSAAALDMPKELVGQLAPDGLMVIPIGKFFQDLFLFDNRDAKTEKLLRVRFVPLITK